MTRLKNSERLFSLGVSSLSFSLSLFINNIFTRPIEGLKGGFLFSLIMEPLEVGGENSENGSIASLKKKYCGRADVRPILQVH